MKSIKNLFLFSFLSIALGGMLVSCGTKSSFKKTKGGMPYQLFKGKDTQQIRMGDVIKMEFTQKIKDSVYFTTVGGLPQYQQISDKVSPYDISELWTSLKLGDSVITTQLIDTFMSRNPQNFPPQFKKGDKIITYVKILAVFRSDSLARIDYEKTNKDWLATEIKTVEKYLADKKITAQKTPSGAFVEILTPGTGNLVDSGNYVTVNYTGVSWSGKKFDSNTDSSFQHVAPYPFVAGTGAMIKGFDEGVQFLRLGGKAKVYIPSMLAYGGSPTSPLIKPFENLIFDLEVINIQDKEPAQVPITQQPPVKVDLPQPQK
ncbi:MAG: FKBP-type peptidyl-prolyl cis-trans isomerase [Bacteroidota bacterium]|nr:FKBP-type peptidyl-prolyl cis-trans isomerase [Bacteroidota bacterium]